jgi:glycosyltransferase involved in cell wall biosynthesis
MPQIPFRRLAAVRKLNLILGRSLVRRAMQGLRFGRTISWFTVPHAGALAGAACESMLVYYCTDNYAAFPDVDGCVITHMDEELTRRAGQVFVSSATLMEKKVAINPHVAYSPHGVDVEMFRKASEAGLEVAEPARRLTPPVIGFFGLIEAWIDLELIGFLARSRPEWTFLLIGRLAVDAGDLAKMPNVVFAGVQPYETLASWAKAFDVAIIPYRLSYQVLNAAPLKLREYLATGKPVVAVSTPDIRKFADFVRIAESSESFLEQVEGALYEDTPDAREKRLQLVARMSWESRVEEIMEIVGQRLGMEAGQVRRA